MVHGVRRLVGVYASLPVVTTEMSVGTEGLTQ